MKWEGQWQEGVILSLYNIIMQEKLFVPGQGLSWEDFWNDPKYATAKANFIQFIYDTTMFLGIGPFIAAMMADWEDELEKEAKQSKTIKDGLAAASANLAIRSVQYGFLDFNYFESIGGTLVDWEPISFQYMQRRITDLVDVLSGDKSLSDALLRTSSITAATKPLWENIIE